MRFCAVRDGVGPAIGNRARCNSSPVKRGKYGEAGMGASYAGSVAYGLDRVRVRPVNPTRPHRLVASRRSTSPASQGKSCAGGWVFKQRILFARTHVLRDAWSSPP